MRNTAKRGELDAALTAADAAADILPLDITDAASIHAAVDEILARAGRIDALVNNAGFGIGGFVEDLTLDEYRRQFETNFFGLVAVTKAVLPDMRRQGSGRIVNISSVNGRVGIGLLSAYVASKFAVEGFSEALAFETRPFGLHTVVIEPGMFKTEIHSANRQLAAAASDPASASFALMPLVEARLEQLGRHAAGDPQQVADTIRHALTVRRPRLRYIVGRDARLTIALHRLAGFSVYAAAAYRAFGIRPDEIVRRLGA